jgi:hypothetical protein
MALIASGDNSSPPNVALDPGGSYRFTITVPLELSDTVAEAVRTIVGNVLGAVAHVQSVTTRSAGQGWTDVVIDFGT